MGDGDLNPDSHACFGSFSTEDPLNYRLIYMYYEWAGYQTYTDYVPKKSEVIYWFVLF